MSNTYSSHSTCNPILLKNNLNFNSNANWVLTARIGDIRRDILVGLYYFDSFLPMGLTGSCMIFCNHEILHSRTLHCRSSTREGLPTSPTPSIVTASLAPTATRSLLGKSSRLATMLRTAPTASETFLPRSAADAAVLSLVRELGTRDFDG